MKLNFNFDTKSLKGDLIQDGRANKVLADIILNKNNEFGLIKAYDMAQKIHVEGTIEIDRSDLEILKKIIKEDESGYIPLVRAQILSSILDQEKEKEQVK